MSATIAGQDFLNDPRTRAVFAALEAAGGADCARLVGGCVRNALMGKAVDDVDIATTLRPEAVMEALKAAGLKCAPTGLDHGTVTAIAEGHPFEVTTLRRDVTTDGRNATVAFTTDWAEDAQRRDFRFNALYADKAGQVFDPVGEGVTDAKAGRVVFVGDPRTRIREDYLRILRFFRFFAWYGRGEPDAAALAACAALKAGMGRLSAERVSKELLKLLAAPDPGQAMALMDQAGVLGQVLPEGADLARLSTVIPLSAEPVTRLAALLPDDEAVARAVAKRLRLSNAQKDRLAAALGPGPHLAADMDEAAARRALYALGREAFLDRLALRGVQRAAPARTGADVGAAAAARRRRGRCGFGRGERPEDWRGAERRRDLVDQRRFSAGPAQGAGPVVRSHRRGQKGLNACLSSSASSGALPWPCRSRRHCRREDWARR